MSLEAFIFERLNERKPFESWELSSVTPTKNLRFKKGRLQQQFVTRWKTGEELSHGTMWSVFETGDEWLDVPDMTNEE